MRVSIQNVPQDNWLNALRARDFLQVVEQVANPEQKSVLEIGCGNGFLSGQLEERFQRAFSIDLNPLSKIKNITLASASALPFKNEAFDFIFSSNVLEHVDSINNAMLEMQRVLRSDGEMIHFIPTVYWKLMQVVFHYVYAFRYALSKLLYSKVPGNQFWDKEQLEKKFEFLQRYSQCKNTFSRKMKKILLPEIHGASGSHVEEFMQFRRRYWRNVFNKNGFKVLKVEPLFLHSPYRFVPYSFWDLRENLSSGGICSAYAYFVKKCKQ